MTIHVQKKVAVIVIKVFTQDLYIHDTTSSMVALGKHSRFSFLYHIFRASCTHLQST